MIGTLILILIATVATTVLQWNIQSSLVAQTFGNTNPFVLTLLLTCQLVGCYGAFLGLFRDAFSLRESKYESNSILGQIVDFITTLGKMGIGGLKFSGIASISSLALIGLSHLIAYSTSAISLNPSLVDISLLFAKSTLIGTPINCLATILCMAIITWLFRPSRTN